MRITLQKRLRICFVRKGEKMMKKNLKKILCTFDVIEQRLYNKSTTVALLGK